MHCPVCSRTLSASGAPCGNRICGWPLEERHFNRVEAVAMYDGATRQALTRPRYDSGLGRAMSYGRLTVGWLGTRAAEAEDIDVIIGNPTPPDRRPHHGGAIVRTAGDADRTGRWPIADPDEPEPVKTAPTAASAATCALWQTERDAAQAHAKELEVRSPVTGPTVMLVDMFATGARTTTVARLLRRRGAREVRGPVLAAHRGVERPAPQAAGVSVLVRSGRDAGGGGMSGVPAGGGQPGGEARPCSRPAAAVVGPP
ncbi:ComF family protein [Kitasatospora sp. cg17-2]